MESFLLWLLFTSSPITPYLFSESAFDLERRDREPIRLKKKKIKSCFSSWQEMLMLPGGLRLDGFGVPRPPVNGELELLPHLVQQRFLQINHTFFWLFN